MIVITTQTLKRTLFTVACSTIWLVIVIVDYVRNDREFTYVYLTVLVPFIIFYLLSSFIKDLKRDSKEVRMMETAFNLGETGVSNKVITLREEEEIKLRNYLNNVKDQTDAESDNDVVFGKALFRVLKDLDGI